MAAALALPGLMACIALPAHAESAPDQTTVGVQYLHYRDWQPYDPAQPKQSGARITAKSPSMYWLVPVGSQLAIEGSTTIDSISGASPRYHNTLSGASAKGYIDDKRKAIDLKATRYEGETSVGVGVSHSSEHDYISTAVAANVRHNTDDNNRTYAMGLSLSSDTINAVTAGVLDRHKRTVEMMVGLTQVVTPVDLAQINLTYSAGKGYFSDPYKDQYGSDVRPDKRNQLAVLLRHNHHFEDRDATLRTTARYYRDSYGVRAVTLGAEWAQELKGGWTLTPSARYTSQRAADFYYDPPFPNGLGVQPYYSADSRLSAFGAITYGLKVEKEVGKSSRINLKVEKYEQRGSWRLGGNGSVGLLPLHALFTQIGWSTRY